MIKDELIGNGTVEISCDSCPLRLFSVTDLRRDRCVLGEGFHMPHRTHCYLLFCASCVANYFYMIFVKQSHAFSSYWFTVIVIIILKFPGTFPKNALINCLHVNDYYE